MVKKVSRWILKLNKNAQCTLFSVFIKNVIKFNNIKIKNQEKWRYQEIIVHL